MFVPNGKNVDWQKIKAAQDKMPDLSVKPIDTEEAEERKELLEFHRKNKFTPANDDERALFKVARDNLQFYNSLNMLAKGSSLELDEDYSEDDPENPDEEIIEQSKPKIHPSFYATTGVKSSLSPLHNDDLLTDALFAIPEEEETNFITYDEYDPTHVEQMYAPADGPDGVVSETLVPFLEDPDEYSHDNLTRVSRFFFSFELNFILIFFFFRTVSHVRVAFSVVVSLVLLVATRSILTSSPSKISSLFVVSSLLMVRSFTERSPVSAVSARERSLVLSNTLVPSVSFLT